jgi:hypothetical protein
MFKDERKRGIWDTVRQHDLQVLFRLLPESLIASAAAQAGIHMGAGALNATTLVWLALMSAVETGMNFAGVLQLVLKLLHDAQEWDGEPSPCMLPQAHRQQCCEQKKKGKGKKGKGKKKNQPGASAPRSKHDPRGGDPNLVSEEAFAQARKRLPCEFWIALILLLNRCFEQEHGQLLRWKKYRLLAMDGTTINLPGHSRLAKHFGTASNQQAGKTVQARMVMLQFPLTRMPWRYTLAPRSQGEITLAGPLLDQLQRDDLVLMDRGYFAYGLFWRVQQRDAYFAIRLPANVKPKHIKHLGHKDRLMSWTPGNRKKWKQFPKSIELRVIDYQIKGFRPSAIVTNVTDPEAITRDQWMRMATQSEAGRHLDIGLYHRRWEIETTFFELKVEQGMEGNLRGRTPECIEYEIAGHVLLYMLTRWLMVEAAAQTDHGDCLRLSFIEATRELDVLRHALLTADARAVEDYLLPLLLERIASHHVPWRPGRYDTRSRNKKVKNKGGGRLQQPSKLLK